MHSRASRAADGMSLVSSGSLEPNLALNFLFRKEPNAFAANLGTVIKELPPPLSRWPLRISNAQRLVSPIAGNNEHSDSGPKRKAHQLPLAPESAGGRWSGCECASSIFRCQSCGSSRLGL